MEGECSTSVDTVRSIHVPSSTLDMTTPSASITSSTTTVTGTQRLPPKAPLSTLPTIPSHPEPSTAAEVPRPVSPTPSNHSLSDADSESSFPSVSSSFFFSSAAHSPYSNPYSQPHLNDSGGEYESQAGEGLHMIIPSLTLPEPVHPTPRPEEEVRLIIVVGSDMSREVEESLSGAYWEEGDNLKVLRGSLSGQEPADLESEAEKRSLRLALWVVEPWGAQDAREINRTIRRLVISSFHLLDSRLHVAHEADTLASSTFFSDVYTAVLICPTASSIDHIGDVEDLIPSIHLDSPISQQTLQDLILPTGLSRQKKEVADNFLRWRASSHDRDTTVTQVQNNVQRMRRWSKAEWEREIEEELGVSLYPISTPSSSSSALPPVLLTARVPPHTVHRFATARAARRRSSREMLALRRNSPSPEATIVSPRPRSPKSTGNGGVRPRKRPLSPPPPLPSSPSPAPSSQVIPPHHSVIVDPLHLPSLVMLGVELVGAMRKRMFGSRRVQKEFELRRKEMAGSSPGSSSPVKFLMLGFCVGVGVGVWLGRVVWGTV